MTVKIFFISAEYSIINYEKHSSNYSLYSYLYININVYMKRDYVISTLL